MRRRSSMMSTVSAARTVGLMLGAVFFGTTLTAVAQDRDALKPQVMREPGFVTDVIDAFDDENGDPFDISVSLGFVYLAKTARILRESSVFAPGLTTGGFTSNQQKVGKYVETTSKLIPALHLGLYKDLSLYMRLPIILTNSRRIDGLDGSGDAGRIGSVLGGVPGEVLFGLPFKSPDRSGLEYIALGIDWGILNQARDSTKPTWLVGFETRLSVGSAMSPCNAGAPNGQVECAHPGDINRNGQNDNSATNDLESAAIDQRSPGVSRGTVGFELHTLVSKRLKYVEPYGGFRVLVETLQGESAYDVTDVRGTLVNNPPLLGGVTVGIMAHPWEDRQAFQRVTLDVRFVGEYHSEGRDYSELFDALGSSSAPSMRNPKWARYRINPDLEADPDAPVSVIDPGSNKTYDTGLSVIEPYGSYRASGSVTWQAGQFVRLQAGLALRFDQAHGISHDQPCNPDANDDVGASGPCHTGNGRSIVSSGIPNPAFRPGVNAVGRRFYVDESITYEVFANGTVMF